MKKRGMTFSEALEVMKQGYKVRRQSWLITECWLTVRNGNICDDTGTTYSDIQSENILANDWEIYNKFEKCAVFVDSEKFREVIKDDYPAFLLWLQREIMGRYGAILEQRIAIAKGETSITTLPRMSFGIAIQALKFGLAIRRAGWNGKGLFVVKQIPAHITEDIIPKMQSLPQSAKDIIMSRENKVIDYTSQMLIINPDGRADSWVPSVSDVFAEDWEIVI